MASRPASWAERLPGSRRSLVVLYGEKAIRFWTLVNEVFSVNMK